MPKFKGQLLFFEKIWENNLNQYINFGNVLPEGSISNDKDNKESKIKSKLTVILLCFFLGGLGNFTGSISVIP
ncbi:MAG: hypothetical protein Ct9H300mP28_33980 [Pseudomonadota bacterium]|nr:MAG: hypothetical protein Ct9H300mP28_33980 [Pseudomonadota bacterium]